MEIMMYKNTIGRKAMKKNIVFLLFFIIVLSTCIYFQGRKLFFQKEQNDLAVLLDVDMTNYPYPSLFPIGYYETILIPGMTINDVHNNIKGYSDVYSCGFAEMYYFFGRNDFDTILISVLYDDAYNLIEIVPEEVGYDPYIPDCKLGKIQTK